MNRNLLILSIMVAAAAGVILLVGYTKGAFVNKPVPQNQPVNQASSNSSPFDNTIFSSQNATVEGEIININGNVVTVKNKQEVTADFPLSSKVIIYKYKLNSSQASSSSDIKSIELNTPSVIALEYFKGQYQITAISYLAKAK